MNNSHSRRDEELQLPAVMKVFALICALGAVLITVGRLALAPAELPAMDTTSFIAPFEATAMSADGHVGDVALPTAAAKTAIVAQPALARSRSP